MRNKFQKWARQYLPDAFISSLIGMIVLAYFFPGIGAKGSVVELDRILHYGIALLFFFYGLRLSPAKLKDDLKNWRLHLTIQSFTFLVFPILVILVRPFFRGTEYELFWLAVFFLAALPSTVSSSVVMVSIAKGNMPGAIFNASISGVIGIVLTPLWMGLFWKSGGGDLSFGDVLGNLITQILLPVVAGLLLHRFWGEWARRYHKHLGRFDKTVILGIVYESFSDSFLTGIFSSIRLIHLVALSLGVVILFFLVFELSKRISSIMKFNREDRITILFCGSKKSLIHGSVMAGVLFSGMSSVSLFLLPVMIYHSFQLFYISIVARKMGKELE